MVYPVEDFQVGPAETILFEVPAYFQQIKTYDMGAALAWRLHARRFFQDAFAGSYMVTDLIFDGGKSYYVLEKEKMIL